MIRRGFLAILFEFILFLLVAEGVQYALSNLVNIPYFLFTPIIFLLVKLFHDFYGVLFWREKLFHYLEDYIKEIIVILSMSILAGGIAYIAHFLIKGSVRITVLAVITSIYLKKNKW